MPKRTSSKGQKKSKGIERFPITMNIDGKADKGMVLVGDAHVSLEFTECGERRLIIMKKDYFFQELVKANRKVKE